MVNEVGGENEQDLTGYRHQDQNTGASRVRSSMENSAPRQFEDLPVGWKNSRQRGLMEHRRNLTRLNRHKISGNAIDDWAEYHKPGE